MRPALEQDQLDLFGQLSWEKENNQLSPAPLAVTS